MILVLHLFQVGDFPVILMSEQVWYWPLRDGGGHSKLGIFILEVRCWSINYCSSIFCLWSIHTPLEASMYPHQAWSGCSFIIRLSYIHRLFHYAGNPSRPPSVAPPNFRANLDNGELLLRWSVMECRLQNSPILHYLIQYSRAGVTGSGTFLRINGDTREIRSSSTRMNGRPHIPDLTQRYEFTVAACRAIGQCGPTALLNIVPSNQRKLIICTQ